MVATNEKGDVEDLVWVGGGMNLFVDANADSMGGIRKGRPFGVSPISPQIDKQLSTLTIAEILMLDGFPQVVPVARSLQERSPVIAQRSSA